MLQMGTSGPPTAAFIGGATPQAEIVGDSSGAQLSLDSTLARGPGHVIREVSTPTYAAQGLQTPPHQSDSIYNPWQQAQTRFNDTLGVTSEHNSHSAGRAHGYSSTESQTEVYTSNVTSSTAAGAETPPAVVAFVAAGHPDADFIGNDPPNDGNTYVPLDGNDAGATLWIIDNNGNGIRDRDEQNGPPNGSVPGAPVPKIPGVQPTTYPDDFVGPIQPDTERPPPKVNPGTPDSLNEDGTMNVVLEGNGNSLGTADGTRDDGRDYDTAEEFQNQLPDGYSLKYIGGGSLSQERAYRKGTLGPLDRKGHYAIRDADGNVIGVYDSGSGLFYAITHDDEGQTRILEVPGSALIEWTNVFGHSDYDSFMESRFENYTKQKGSVPADPKGDGHDYDALKAAGKVQILLFLSHIAKEGAKEIVLNVATGGLGRLVGFLGDAVEVVYRNGKWFKRVKNTSGQLDEIELTPEQSKELREALERNVAPGSGIIRGGNKSRVVFDGMEVRGVKDLSHVSDSTLKQMAKDGFAAKDINGRSLQLHHIDQDPAGPLVEIPDLRHKISNEIQHPLGNAPGVGLTAEQRAEFDAWRINYWKARAEEELARRGIAP